MRFDLHITDRAFEDLRSAARWYLERSGSHELSQEWLHGFLDSIA